MSEADKILESLPPELRERWLRGTAEFVEVMDHFHATDAKYVQKESMVLEQAKNKIFATHPPERWAELGKSLYLRITAGMN